MFGFDNKVQDQPADNSQPVSGTPPLPYEQTGAPAPMAQTDPSRSFLKDDHDLNADEGTSMMDTPSDSPVSSMPSSDHPPVSPAPAPQPSVPTAGDDLLSIKQTALQQLTPLVGHLEQNPEEKFKTTMMMIQASDDQTLVPVAYEAANAITDEKAKAQALLDIVNEINYFTQHHQG